MIDYVGWILLGTGSILWLVGFIWQLVTQDGYWENK
tara:strand:- start:435 stop:542 length:108 start_codon:yes stop_codon:yes gene_type:complete